MDFKNAKKYILDRLEGELKPNLHYHGVHHTVDVYEASIRIAELEGLNQDEKVIINTAALYHDAGFIYQYEHNEEVAAQLVKVVLPKFGYQEKEINEIEKIILSTKIKARPSTLYEKIMSDADYDYLGRNDVAKIAETLHKELFEYDFKFSEDEWNEVQIKFLEKHLYYTGSSLTLRRPKKLEYYEHVKSLLK
ncbi:MAG: HD domain-containing protein [Vicingaceae bacterium]|nr:HD domain-containing protein [Vicingaceae bacterium]